MGLHAFWALSDSDKQLWTNRLKTAGFTLDEVFEFDHDGQRVTRAHCYVLDTNGKRQLDSSGQNVLREWRQAKCICTTTGTCRLCRPPCEYDGQDFFTFIVDTPVCLDCWEYYQDQAPLRAGIW